MYGSLINFISLIRISTTVRGINFINLIEYLKIKSSLKQFINIIFGGPLLLFFFTALLIIIGYKGSEVRYLERGGG